MSATYGQDLWSRAIWYSQIAQQRCEDARAEFRASMCLLSPEILYDN